MTSTATLSSRFKVTIPKAVRDAHAWEAGQEFAFIARGRGVLLMPVPSIDELRGIAKGADPSDYRDRRIDTDGQPAIVHMKSLARRG